MFDSLTGRLQDAFKNLRGLGRISESNVAESLREVRMALLEADVNFKVVKNFIDKVKEKAIGEKVIQSIQPGQQIVKIIHEELVTLLGSKHDELDLQTKPSSIMMIGLHGSGKTTSSGKLAKMLLKNGRRPLLVAADVYRPAAMDQLETLAKQIGVPSLILRGETRVLKIAKQAQKQTAIEDCDVVIYDTAGRLQMDQTLIQELIALKSQIQPEEILLVLDSATGQEAVNVATHFNNALDVSGCVLTKLDGDARGGAALSMKAAVGKPIKLVGTGEHLEDFEPFHPDRMASRILGMGDVVSLVEKAAEAVDQKKAKQLEERMRRGGLTLVDFLDQLRQMRKLGSLESLVGMLPGAGDMLKGADLNRQEKSFRRMEAMICAMTPTERLRPQILNARRRQRIAAGSGVRVSELNNLLNRFSQMRKMMKKTGKYQKMMRKMSGTMPGMPFR